MSALAEHTVSLTKLAAAKTAEKEARRLNHEERDADAIAMYVHARDLYRDTNLALDDNDLAEEVQRAIRRCDAAVQNIRHPKVIRPPATTPRPNCLCCKKPLRRYKTDGRAFGDGTPREWGDYGDNRFCGLRCGWTWACRNSTLPTKAKARP